MAIVENAKGNRDMFCKKCGMILHPEESANYGLCENCYNEYLNCDEEISIKEFLSKDN